MIRKFIKTTFLTPGELKKVKAADLGKHKELSDYRNAFVKQCEEGFLFSELKEKYNVENKDLFQSVSTEKYEDSILKILEIANVPLLQKMQSFSTPEEGLVYFFRDLIVSPQLGYNTYVEHKVHETKLPAKMRRNAILSDKKIGESCELPYGRDYLIPGELMLLEGLPADSDMLEECKHLFIQQVYSGAHDEDMLPHNDLMTCRFLVAELLRRAGFID